MEEQNTAKAHIHREHSLPDMGPCHIKEPMATSAAVPKVRINAHSACLNLFNKYFELNVCGVPGAPEVELLAPKRHIPCIYACMHNDAIHIILYLVLYFHKNGCLNVT